MHGTAAANYAVTNCDLLLAIGARFDDRVTGDINAFAPHAQIIHLDIDPAEIGKNVRVDIPIVGDIKILFCPPAAVVARSLPRNGSRRLERWKSSILWPISLRKERSCHRLSLRSCAR